jgi:hypothetical protein
MIPEMNIEIYVPSGMTMEDKKKKVDEIIAHMEQKHSGVRCTLKFNIVFA